MSALSHILAPAEPDPLQSSPTARSASEAADNSNNNNTTNATTKGDPSLSRPAQSHSTQHDPSNARSDPPSPRTDDALKQDDEPQAPSSSKKAAATTPAASSTVGAGNNNLASVYTGNKIRHLKKEDGIPLWRRDIQYDFLKLVFGDKTACFSKYSDGTSGHTFADVYIDAMAKSSKCSKILKEKLLQDGDSAISMAMVCLLVNVGRMNTTLNFFPEMRAQLRTYHSIPALQAQQDPNAYKQLQDAPRLKSILKGATEDEPQPSTIEEIKATAVPRTNPVNLIFVMSQYAPRVNELHFSHPYEFFDLVVRSSLSSASRARAFLWLIWWYLESDFSLNSLQNNPFGAGQYGDDRDDPDALPLKVPPLESLTEEQAALENADTESEQHFGEVKRKERISILASEPSPAMTALKRARKEKGLATYSDDETMADIKGPIEFGRSLLTETGSEHTRSPSPAMRSQGFQALNATPKLASDMRINTLLNSEAAEPGAQSPTETTTAHAAAPTTAPAKKGPGRGNWRRNKPKQEPTRNGGAGETPHHVPLLPNTSQYGFVTEMPGVQHIQPAATPGSTSHQPMLAPSAAGSPIRSSNISFQPPRTGASGPDHVPTPSYQAQKRTRGPTQHQSALVNHRRKQIEYILDRRVRHVHNLMKVEREAEGAVLRGWKRVKLLPDGYDSGEEIRNTRSSKTGAHESEWRSRDQMEVLDDWETPKKSRVLFAGLGRVGSEVGDVGEEARALAKTLMRARRRLGRWQDELTPPGMAMIRRRHLQARGMLEPVTGTTPLPMQQLSMAHDGVEILDEDRQRAGSRRRRGGGGGGGTKAKRARVERSVSAKDIQDEPMGGMDEDDGGGELDEEDRELLGEVDADESDSGAEDDEE